MHEVPVKLERIITQILVFVLWLSIWKSKNEKQVHSFLEKEPTSTRFPEKGALHNTNF